MNEDACQWRRKGQSFQQGLKVHGSVLCGSSVYALLPYYHTSIYWKMLFLLGYYTSESRPKAPKTYEHPGPLSPKTPNLFNRELLPL